jgi:4-amino-4-deoxy-L-arabinose transferase-like glycosyltransferase
VKVILQYLRRESLWPLLVAVIAAAILLPGLDRAGFWEPQEIRVADRAHERLQAGAGEDPDGEGGEGPSGEGPSGEGAAGKARAQPEAEPPPLLPWSMAEGMRLVGGNKELGARLPLALLGLVTVLATFLLGRRLASARAGLLSALVLLAFPLLLFQSRQLMSDIGVVAGSALVMLGLVGLAWPADAPRRPWHAAVDAALMLAGAAIGYYAAAALLGLVVPFGAMGLACLAGLTTAGETAPAADVRARRRQRARLATVAGLALAVAALALAWVLAAIFELRDPIPGQRALFGHSIVPTTEYVAPLGGVWMQSEDERATFDILFEQIAYGLFPWSALAPIALVHLAMGVRRGRAAWAGLVPLAWALVAWVVASVMARKVGNTLYPGLPAVALGVGMWLDHLLAARERAQAAPDSSGDTLSAAADLPLRLPLVALFAFLAALVLGKDLLAFPERITSLNALENIEYPKEMTLLGLDLKVYWLAFGALFGLALAGGLWMWERDGAHGGNRPAGRQQRALRALGRHGIAAALAAGLCFALFLVHGWLPAMSHKLSSKELYAAYDDLRDDAEPLGVLGNPGSGLTYYAGDSYRTLPNRDALIDFLREPGRVFALAPASELCALHRTIRGAVGYHVLDNSHAKFLLLSNQLERGETDRNPLAQAIVREPPRDIQRPLRVDFDGRVELIGVAMPEAVDRGDTFRMTLYFRVLRPLGASWKMFLHFDGGGMRFQGDHDPIEGRCATTFWQPGDYIVDTFEVEAGNLTYAKTDYTVYAGFFRGSGGNWSNMPVKSAADGSGRPLSTDPNHRVNIGTLRVR